MTDSKALFERVFRLNVERRSRTAKGRDEGSKTSSKKKPLLLQGDALKAQVAANVERLISVVWRTSTDAATANDCSDASQKALCERFYDIVNEGLYGPEAYVDELRQLQDAAAKLEDAFGRKLPTNPRYRLWTPMYTYSQVSPLLLGSEVERFYGDLSGRLGDALALKGVEALTTEDVAELLAYIDVMQDGELHPWLDGCGRVATAHVMWVCNSLGHVPPLFAPTKDEHYADIRDPKAHARYYLECFKRTRELA